MRRSPVAAGLVVVLLAGLVQAQIPKDGRCIWYGKGPQNPEGPEGGRLNSAYTGPGIVLEDPLALLRMDEHCSVLMKELREEYGESVPMCCSADNINDMTQQISMLDPFLRNCEACRNNINIHLCYSTCHPRHSNFLIPTKMYKYTDAEGQDKEAVLEVDFHVTDHYTNTTYDSCKGVYIADVDRPALSVLCGSEGYNCDPYKLFTYFGNNSMSSFAVTFRWGNTPTPAQDADTCEIRTMTPFLEATTPCNTSDPSMHCRCHDCFDSCTFFPDIPSHPDLPMVGNVDIITFTLIIVYCILAIAIIFAACFCWSSNDGGCCCDCSCLQAISAGIEKGIRNVFTSLGTGVASYPLIFLAVGACVVVGLSVGITYLEVTTDPEELWTSSASKTRQQKDYFDSHLSPSARTTRVIVTPKGYEWEYVTVDDTLGMEQEYLFGPALNSTFVQRVMKLQTQIMELAGEVDGQPVSLTEVCEKPNTPKSHDCRIESVMNYWQNDPLSLNQSITEGSYSNKMVQCINYPASTADLCLASFGGPVQPYTALGGFPEGENLLSESRYTESTALIITIHINNHLEKDLLAPAMAWEKRFIEFMKEVSADEQWTVDMDIAFTAERGVEDELKQESQVAVVPLAAAYLTMLVILTFSLGNLCVECGRLMVESKFLLSVGCVTLVLLSTAAAFGLYGYVGVPATLLVMQVIPFLVLGVGVDNMVILVRAWQREPRNEGESVEEHVGRVVGEVAHGMLLSTTAEALCFFLGALSDTPAVYGFSLYAGFALVMMFFLQMTCFVAFMSLDARRVEDNRWDVLCCIKGSSRTSAETGCSCCTDFFGSFYAPFILSDVMRVLICLVFTGVTCAALASAPHIEIGLDQDLSMPDDSFELKYFEYAKDYLAVGPPLYFVMKGGYNFTDWDEQNLVCDTYGCNDDSILQQIFLASFMSDDTYIAVPAKSWLSNYFSWISDGVAANFYTFACCRLDSDGNFIDSSDSFDFDAVATCRKQDDFVDGRLKPQYFMEHVQDFLSDNPHGTGCSAAGHPTFGQTVEVVDDGLTGEQRVGATDYKTFHTSLKTSGDFIRALEISNHLTDDMTAYLRSHSKYSPDIEVFPYSIFYVYYEQYLTMWQDTGINLGITIGSVFGVTLLLTFDLASSFVILATVSMITADMMGYMYWWNVSLNAVSLVNLMMIIGISVEFCSHMTHAFAISVKPTRLERAREALATVGSSVFSGITFTKIGGIIALGFAQSQIFRVFYAKMYLGMLLFGTSHGFMFLPVLLSLCGPPVNQALLDQKKKKDEVEALEIKLKETQKQNVALKRQLDAQVAMNRSQEQETVVASVTVQRIQQHQPQPSLYPALPLPDSINPQVQGGEKQATSIPTTSAPSAPSVHVLFPPPGGVTNKGYQA